MMATIVALPASIRVAQQQRQAFFYWLSEEIHLAATRYVGVPAIVLSSSCMGALSWIDASF
jgi:hypothetical protein